MRMEIRIPYTSGEQHPAPSTFDLFDFRTGMSPDWSRLALVAVRTSENCMRLNDQIPRIEIHRILLYRTYNNARNIESCIALTTKQSRLNVYYSYKKKQGKSNIYCTTTKQDTENVVLQLQQSKIQRMLYYTYNKTKYRECCTTPTNYMV